MIQSSNKCYRYDFFGQLVETLSNHGKNSENFVGLRDYDLYVLISLSINSNVYVNVICPKYKRESEGGKTFAVSIDIKRWNTKSRMALPLFELEAGSEVCRLIKANFSNQHNSATTIN